MASVCSPLHRHPMPLEQRCVSFSGFPLQTSCPGCYPGFQEAGCRAGLWCQVLGLSGPRLATAAPSAGLERSLTPLSGLLLVAGSPSLTLAAWKTQKDPCLGLIPRDSVLMSVEGIQAAGVLKAASGAATFSPV